ncbi:cardiolipin synthase [Sulfurimonas autotrophica]|uniref:Cardiolipin synthase n=1 Tax=Sulfurimonas autotrophica (strain ATCC BAA-671 / DSM 16294 / JCM 11897 / OK10) TaxID=563040 RepID=E0UUJ7_SULAO|nr:cardiolipin synthase [Sulfurimonas autotrophica]ADN08433.1 phospholipase D/Transphosphatidylase [Sulfurimonas autotrophica DSM 16294]
MLFTIVLFVYILGLLSALNAIMTARTSQGATAWVISLVTLPYIAVPLYWFFGRSKFNGYTAARKKAEKLVTDRLQNIVTQTKNYIPQESALGIFERTSQQLAKMPYLQANELDLLIDGEKTFQSILAGINEAEKYILLEFYIIRDDNLGYQIQRTLIKKANEGVKIYFLYDEIGSYELSQNYLDEMRQAGIQVYNFHTQKGIKNRFQINFRNHRKIVVVDGKSAWIGGHNIGDEYLSKNKKFGHWRDTHIKITGPSVIAVQTIFIEDWYWAAEYLIDCLKWNPVSSKKENKKVLIVPSSPADILETASLMFMQAINSATKRIWISSSYFVPDSAIIKALQLAGLRGIDVRILIPKRADHILVYLAAFSYFKTVSATGVKFFRYNNGFLHQKVMLIDDSHTAVSTANLDNRSFRLNFEITALVTDNSFAQEIKEMFENDFRHSYEIKIAELEKQAFLFKLATRLARLTSPVL